jgi:hypothetical protein
LLLYPGDTLEDGSLIADSTGKLSRSRAFLKTEPPKTPWLVGLTPFRRQNRSRYR